MDGDNTRDNGVGPVTNLAVYLQQDLIRDIRDIEVVEVEQGVILRGSTRTYYAKQMAQEVFQRHSSRRIAANEIAVQAPPSGRCT